MNELIAGIQLWQKWLARFLLEFLPWIFSNGFWAFNEGLFKPLIKPVLVFFFSLFKIAVIVFLEFILLTISACLLMRMVDSIIGEFVNRAVYGFIPIFCGFAALGSALHRIGELLAGNPITQTPQHTSLR